MTKPRLRFAPSPTGYLHIGGVRTALFNWLWARKTGGTFVLRIEDTDRERSTVENEEIILREMRWLGLEWDEGPSKGGAYGPYRQMERLELYREFADKLVASGAAYRCYATKEELDAAREALRLHDPKAQFRYPGWWRDKGPADWPADKPYVIRLRTPQSGHTGWNDLVFGEQRVPNDTIQDVVLVRSDGVPLYKLARQGKEVEREPRLVHVFHHAITRFEPPEIDFRVLCSKGFYVRTYAHDIGQRLGCGAHLSSLRRTRSGKFDLTRAVSFQQLKEGPVADLHAAMLSLPDVSRLRGV